MVFLKAPSRASPLPHSTAFFQVEHGRMWERACSRKRHQLRRLNNPQVPITAGTPNPTQLNESHHPSPSNAANNPAALSTPIPSGIPNTFQKLDCLGFMSYAERPWYMDAMGMSQPMHFGDYGGMPMKILWAVLDVLTIIVLGSGVYLWIVRRKT